MAIISGLETKKRQGEAELHRKKQAEFRSRQGPDSQIGAGTTSAKQGETVNN